MSYTIVKDGIRYTPTEWEKSQEKRAERNRSNLSGILDSRQAPGGHAPYWGTGWKTSAGGVCPGQEASHQAWIDANGITGARVMKGGDVELSSPLNKEKYLAARGLVDQSSGGSDPGARNRANGASFVQMGPVPDSRKQSNDPRTRMGRW